MQHLGKRKGPIIDRGHRNGEKNEWDCWRTRVDKISIIKGTYMPLKTTCLSRSLFLSFFGGPCIYQIVLCLIMHSGTCFYHGRVNLAFNHNCNCAIDVRMYTVTTFHHRYYFSVRGPAWLFGLYCQTSWSRGQTGQGYPLLCK